MADVSYRRTVGVAPARVAELLLDPELLARWARAQEPTEHTVTVADGRAEVRMVLPTTGIPSMFRSQVGSSLPLTIRLAPSDRGTLEVVVTGKVTGRLDARLGLTPRGEGTEVTVDGDLGIKAGLISRPAATMARDSLVLPVLDELFDLVRDAG